MTTPHPRYEIRLQNELDETLIPEIPAGEKVNLRDALNRLIRGRNHDTVRGIKVQHGLEHLHAKSKKNEQNIRLLQERNEILDGYMHTIAEYITGAMGWWAILVLKIVAFCLTVWALETALTFFFHHPVKIPASVSTFLGGS